MATYSGQVEIIQNSQNKIANTSNITVNFYAIASQASGWSNYVTYPKCTVDGVTETKTLTSFDFRNNLKILIASITKDIAHNSNGEKTVSASFTWDSDNSYVGTVTGSASLPLTTIPRYATSVQSLNSKTLNSIKMNWSSDSTIDYVWYSKDNGSNWTAVGSVNASSGNYTISGLSTNTTYSIKTRVRRKDSQLTTDSGTLSVTTYDYAKLSAISNFNLGDSKTISYSNPSGASIFLGIYKDGSTEYIPYRLVSGSSYTFSFTDAELDILYKAMGTSNSLKVRFYLRTDYNGSSYYDYKEATIALTGNQKTGHIKVSGSWKRNKVWTKINGNWKRCVVWKNINGNWRRCI